MNPILRAPDGATSADMIADGWERQVEQRHRKRCRWAHAGGKHHSPVQECAGCAFQIALLCSGWYEPRKGVEELFGA